MTEPLAVRLDRNAEALTRAVLVEMYADPFWDERFGERGRQRSTEDGRYHVAYLIQALVASDPNVLAGYARWLRTVLTTRGMCTLHLSENFERLARVIGETEPQSHIAVEYLQAARAALLDEQGPARELQLISGELAASALAVLAGGAGSAHPVNLSAAGPGTGADPVHLLSYLVDALSLGTSRHFVAHLEWLAGCFARRAAPGGAERLRTAVAQALMDAPGLGRELREAAGRILAEAQRALGGGADQAANAGVAPA